jgi:signal transduction histidine kinase
MPYGEAAMPTLRELVASRRARILERWIERLQREHARPGTRGSERGKDLSAILDELGAVLSAGDRRPLGALPSRARRAAADREARRGGGGSVDTETVVREYGVLADVLLDELAATGSALDPGEWQLVQRWITEALASHAKRHDEELHRRTGRQLAFIAHELRNSLGTVGSAIATLRRAPAAEGLYGVLDRNLRRVGELVDEVLTADRLASRVDLQRTRLDLGRLLRDVVEEARTAGETRKVRIALEVDGALEVRTDPRLLHSTIGNVLSNAVKFSRAGATVRVRARREDRAVVMEVEDECGGLPPGNIARLFEPFVRHGADGNGFGLGLAIVRRAVSALGGHVVVRNSPGQGCTFAITLPIGNDVDGWRIRCAPREAVPAVNRARDL